MTTAATPVLDATLSAANTSEAFVPALSEISAAS